VANQALDIRHKFPGADVPNPKCNKLICTLMLKPTNESHNYKVRIEYQFQQKPRVFVLNPQISSDSPHLYRSNHPAIICLYYPREKEWTPRDYIANTIIPWTSIWLYTYEIWQMTGVWTHAEAPHSINNKDKKQHLRGVSI